MLALMLDHSQRLTSAAFFLPCRESWGKRRVTGTVTRDLTALYLLNIVGTIPFSNPHL